MYRNSANTTGLHVGLGLSCRKRRRHFHLVLAVSALCAYATCHSGVRAGEPAPATTADIAAAREILDRWTAHFQAGEYREQWSLTDPRIRRWHDKERWRGWMKKAARRNGKLLTYTVEGAAPADAESLPCTENHHCFRKGIAYVLFRIRSTYEIATPAQPEFVVMALSDEGWRFGGGTFLNRPLGETAVIMTQGDEERYKVRYLPR